MKFTLKWLEEHLDTEASLDQIVAKLTMIGLEVDAVEDRAAALAPFTVAYVKEARPHPNADRLSVCIVDTGEAEVQVVCGAPNARSGMKGVFAPAGAYIPGTDMVLKPGEIRGEASNGMLVSEREMGLSDEHEGIIELPEDAVVGTPFAELLGLDDPVIDIAITPNRGDCLGVRGIARDLAAAGLGTLKPFDAAPVPGSFDSPLAWQRDLPGNLQDACPYVAGRYFRNVKNGPSPAWMQARLRAIGLRPISALVDITNYVTYDLGRPLHVFDADKVNGDPTMRMARAGEEILALDGESYKLDPDMVVIDDERGPEGIGGVMGGERSGCTETTTNVFLEVALFEPVRVAATGRKLGILSDARYRFERGLDPQSAVWGVEVAARLVRELCGGEASHVVSAGELPSARRVIEHRPTRVARLGGLEVAIEEQIRILIGLGFEVAGKIVVLQQDPVFQGLMPALDLALGLRMIGCAADMFHAPIIEPVGQIAGDVARPVVGQQPGPVHPIGLVQPRCLQRRLQRVGDVAGLHGGAELPGDDVAREVVEDGREIEPAPADHLEISEVGLPELVRRRGLIPELVRRLDHDEGRAGDQVVRLEQAVDRSL